MAFWNDWLSPKGRRLSRARALLGADRFAEALSATGGGSDPETRLVADEIRDRWITAALQGCNRGDPAVALDLLDRSGLDEMDREDLERGVRVSKVVNAVEDVWAKLLKAAGVQERRLYGPRSTSGAPRHKHFFSPRLAEVYPEPDGLESEADSEKLRALLAPRYPSSFAPMLAEADRSLLVAAGLLAAGRPDRAVLPLLESGVRNALTHLERARIAWALGYPRPAALACADLRHALHEHVMVEGVHTGVLHARALSASGRRREALDLLRTLSLARTEEVVLFEARLLQELGDSASALLALGDLKTPAVDVLRDELRRSADPRRAE